MDNKSKSFDKVEMSDSYGFHANLHPGKISRAFRPKVAHYNMNFCTISTFEFRSFTYLVL